jgi:hypothetical protein
LGNFTAMVAVPKPGPGDSYMRLSIRHISRIEESVLANGEN